MPEETKFTQDERWCASDIDGAITMHGWDELMKVRKEWLPKIGEAGWRKAFSSVGDALRDACISAGDYEDVQAGRQPSSTLDPDAPISAADLARLNGGNAVPTVEF